MLEYSLWDIDPIDQPAIEGILQWSADCGRRSQIKIEPKPLLLRVIQIILQLIRKAHCLDILTTTELFSSWHPTAPSRFSTLLRAEATVPIPQPASLRTRRGISMERRYQAADTIMARYSSYRPMAERTFSIISTERTKAARQQQDCWRARTGNCTGQPVAAVPVGTARSSHSKSDPRRRPAMGQGVHRASNSPSSAWIKFDNFCAFSDCTIPRSKEAERFLSRHFGRL